VVEDRYQLLKATRTLLESIFLLYADPEKHIDAILQEALSSAPAVQVEAKPGEVHALYQLSELAAESLRELFVAQRPIIADGHHRYTTSIRFARENPSDHAAGWQLMTFANLYGDGLSILATHRLVKLSSGRGTAGALEILRERLEDGSEDSWDLRVETRDEKIPLRFPEALRQGRQGAGRTDYALLHDVILGDWLKDWTAEDGVRYFKENTGESEALARGEGDILVRLQPVARPEFQSVVEAGEVFPHKTTYFYPKLWSGLLMWPLEAPEA
jgi:uncharacterized protein (DUF1015 family)